MGLWGCGTVGLWDYGTVELWGCGAVGLWDYGTVRMWGCGGVGVWDCGAVGVWSWRFHCKGGRYLVTRGQCSLSAFGAVIFWGK